MPDEINTTADRAEKEFDAWKSLLKRRPILAIGIIAIFLFSIGLNIYNQLYGIPSLKEKIIDSNKKLDSFKSDLQLCETRLTPFKTVAIEWYSGPVGEALAKLSLRIKEIDRQLKADKKFHEVAKIEINGSNPLGGISTSTAASGWAENCTTIKDSEIEFICNNKCMNQYSKFIKTAPWWPYPFFGLAECSKQKNNQKYKSYAEIGITLLNEITLVPFHRPEHDRYLKFFKAKYPEARILKLYSEE